MHIKKTILFILFFVIYSQTFSQDIQQPLSSASFGLNHHTNRDIAYFSHLDSNRNTIVVATTEKDSTFTDILTTKLDEDYNLVWQRNFSLATNLSYDIPVKSFLDSNNELSVICRSSFNQSHTNGLIFIIKYDAEGNLLYHKVIGNIDGSDYYDYEYMDVDLNVDGSLSMVYALKSNVTGKANLFNFIKIDNLGNIVHSFTKEIEHQNIIGIIDSENFYFLVKEVLNESTNTFTYKFYRILDENNVSVVEITDADFIANYKYIYLQDKVKLTIDSNKNCYLTCPYISGNINNTYDKIHLTKIDSINNISYALSTSDSDYYSLVDSFINNQNSNIIIANNLNTNSIDFLSVDENDAIQVITNPANFLATGFKENKDGSFFITTSNSNIRLFSNELIEYQSFNTSDTYELIDFSKNDEDTITAIGIRYDKMFPESEYSTQLDIIVEKINESQIIDNYSYSGIGTSRAFQQKLIIDRDNNYLVLVTEKMGPEDLGLGGQNPPLNNRIIKYDPNLNVLWETVLPDEVVNIVNYIGTDVGYYLDANNNLYLNLPVIRDINNVDFKLYIISPDGNIEFLSDSYSAYKFCANESNIFIASGQFTNTSTGIKHFLIYKLDKNNGNLLEEIKIESENILEFFNINSDIYFYSYNSYYEQIYLYKNNVKIFTRYLPPNYGIFPYEIDKEGTLFLVTNSAVDRNLSKIDINNSIRFYKTPSHIVSFKEFNNGKVLVYLENENSIVLDSNLNYISNGENIRLYSPYLMSLGNYILLGNFNILGANTIKVIDENGMVVNLFETLGYLHDWYSKIDHLGNLIMVGQFGNRIFTFDQYGWYRGFIHNYGSLDTLLSIEDIAFNSQEEESYIYPNPTSNRLHIKIPNHTIERVVLYDISGKQLKVFKSNEISLANYKRGIYFIKIFTNTNSIINQKIIRN